MSTTKNGNFFRQIHTKLEATFTLLNSTTVLFFFGAFFFDLLTPRGIVGGIAYIGVMLNCLWYKSTKTIFIFAIVCSLFITIDFFLKQPSLTPEWIVILNRIICIVTIWLLSVVIYIAHRNKHATEKKIMDSEILASIVKASNDGIISKSIDGTIISWNKGAQNIFGYTAEEMIGNNIRLLIPEDRIEEENIIINKIKQGEIIYNYETVRIKKGNIPIYVSLTISPIYDANGNFVSISKIARDITQNIAREEKFRLIVKWSPYSITVNASKFDQSL